MQCERCCLDEPVAYEPKPPLAPRPSVPAQVITGWIIADMLSGADSTFADRAAFIVYPFVIDAAANAGAEVAGKLVTSANSGTPERASS